MKLSEIQYQRSRWSSQWITYTTALYAIYLAYFYFVLKNDAYSALWTLLIFLIPAWQVHVKHQMTNISIYNIRRLLIYVYNLKRQGQGQCYLTCHQLFRIIASKFTEPTQIKGKQTRGKFVMKSWRKWRIRLDLMRSSQYMKSMSLH